VTTRKRGHGGTFKLKGARMDIAESTVSYREIKGHPGYRVGNDGTVWSCWKRVGQGRGIAPLIVTGPVWHQLKTRPSQRYGYHQVNLGRRNPRRVGPLILAAFVGPCPDGMECCHKNGIASDNRVSNLRWGTSKDNTDDQRRHSTLIGGERHGMAKLTNDQIDEIKALAGTMPQWQIGERFGISQPHVSEILNGKKRTTSSHAGKGLNNG